MNASGSPSGIVSRVDALHAQVERAVGARERARGEYAANEAKRKALAERLARLQEAQVILQKVAGLTQKQLEYRVSELATLALASVFSEPYGMSLKFASQRGRSEAVLSFTRDGMEIPPLSAAGCGAVDVASLALRVSLMRLTRPSPRPTVVLDEPLRFLSTDLMPKAAEMLKRLSEKLGIQFIVVTHEEELAEAADKVFRVTIRKGRSKVEVV